MNKKILIVDDEQSIQELVAYNLEQQGFHVIKASEGLEALEIIKVEEPDLILLDIMMPQIDGLEVCRRVRQKSSTPIIMLTARSTETDKVIGLDYGADDYITKPFSPRELIARIKALLRRSDRQFSKGNNMNFGEIEIDLEKREVKVSGQKIDLTYKEFELLYMLAKKPGRIYTREQLLERIWNIDHHYDTRTVDVHIRYLRAKIEKDPSRPKFIQTVRGVGYRFEALDHV